MSQALLSPSYRNPHSYPSKSSGFLPQFPKKKKKVLKTQCGTSSWSLEQQEEPRVGPSFSIKSNSMLFATWGQDGTTSWPQVAHSIDDHQTSLFSWTQTELWGMPECWQWKVGGRDVCHSSAWLIETHVDPFLPLFPCIPARSYRWFEGPRKWWRHQIERTWMAE